MYDIRIKTVLITSVLYDDDFEKIFQKLFDNLLGDDDNIPEEESEVSELSQ